MKALLIAKEGRLPACESVALKDGASPKVSVVADSAIGRDVMPLFLPDTGDEWALDIAPAVRIGRLGKNIAERFAMRYVEAVSAVCLLGAADPRSTFYTTGLDSYIDGRITAGQWLTKEGRLPACANEGGEVNDNACDNEDFTLTASTPDDILWSETLSIYYNRCVARAISEVSRLATLKSGDLLIFPGLTPAITPRRDMRLTVTLNATEVLKLKIK